MWVCGLLALAAAGFATGSIEYADPVETAAGRGGLTRFVRAVEAAGLEATVRGEGPLTVFAPSDRAFANLSQETVDALLSEPQALRRIMSYHLVPRSLRSSELARLGGVRTLRGELLAFSQQADALFAGGAEIMESDIETSNGVMHVVDRLLIPESVNLDRLLADDVLETVAADARLSRFADALRAAEAAEWLAGYGGATVFAPTDSAFEKLPSGALQALLNDIPTLSDILRYHIIDEEIYRGELQRRASAMTVLGQPVAVAVSDGDVFVNDSRLVASDVLTAQGVLHLVDTVLLPPDRTILERLRNDGRFGTLLSALDATALASTFDDQGPYTLFAPTDSAFRRLPEGTLDSLFSDVPYFSDVLLYHTLPDHVFAGDLFSRREVASLQGEAIEVLRSGASVVLDGEANVTAVNVLASNGVIHVVDRLIMPTGD
jgi:uncharacterized surface protein with fasciclin (FAS1) repeats